MNRLTILHLYPFEPILHLNWRKWFECLSSKSREWLMFIMNDLKAMIEDFDIDVAIVPLPPYEGKYIINYIFDFVAAYFEEEYESNKPIAIFVIYLDEDQHIKYLRLMGHNVRRDKKMALVDLLKQKLKTKWEYTTIPRLDSQIFF